MKIVLANKFFFENGGAEAVLFQERAFLKTAGLTVLDFSMEHPRNQSSKYSATFVKNLEYNSARFRDRISASASLLHSREAVNKLKVLINEEKPDLLHCHNIYHQLTPSIIRLAKRHGLKVVLTLHDYKTVCPAYLCLRNGKVCVECIGRGFSRVVANRCAGGSILKSGLLYLEATLHRLIRSYEFVDQMLAPSEFMRDMVTSRFPSKQIEVLRNGVDTDTLVPTDGDAGYVLFMGRLSSEKGVEVLLRAHALLGATFRLLVAGTGPLESKLRHEFPSVEFLGHLSGEPLKHALSQAAVVVVPSECYENCPMTLLEAMAYGRAVIASQIGGIPEIVVHGETGLLTEPGNVESIASALNLVLASYEFRRRLGEAGRRRVEGHFSARKHNEQLLEVYTRLLQATNSRTQRKQRMVKLH